MRKLLVVLAIAVGLVAWFAWSRKSNQNAPAPLQQPQQNSQQPQPTAAVPVAAPQAPGDSVQATSPAATYSQDETAYAAPRRSQSSRPAPRRAPSDRRPVYSTSTQPAAEPSPAPASSVEAQLPSPLPPAPAEPSSEPRRARQDEVIAQSPEPVPPPPPREERMVIPSGTELAVRTLDRISSEDSQNGEKFAAVLDTDVYLGGKMIIPANSEITGRVVSVKQAGKVGGRAELVLELDSILINGEHRNLRTSKVTMQGESSVKEDAARIGGGAALGALLGAITGGKKGAAVGAAVGAAGGTAGAVMTRGKPVRIGPESQLRFRLDAPLEVVIR